ncbi:Rap1-interacting factor 1 N terminal [Geosmithia morbida]|uniref:Rap1-interacting factor 1 N terminal n=1 Tax=Geosmithia morbida TaxID=1094350 RepID=A0A9P4YRE6_9HYPO|nr:Rap1-interacting factor 1 N terminal [Geosmithia morbida]KAF4121733.1 Rap1-interacting factor 1 N terminal [Geosmithia morbida]
MEQRASTLLEKLPARPPTPPRDTTLQEIPDLFKNISSQGSPYNPRLDLHTPPNANAPAGNSTNPDSSRIRKRVLWSAHTEYRDPPDYRPAADGLHRSPLVSAPSSASGRPLKGILKPSPSPNPLAASLGDGLDAAGGAHVNITEMLDSTIKQLTGSDRTSKLDAYMMLSRALKASNNLPDRVALQHKMSLLVQFIQRDVTYKNEDGIVDTSLVNHALTLLNTFLCFHAIASTINSEFAIFVIDHSIRIFEDRSASKDVVRHFMQVVAIQNFSAKVMTADRVGRLITSLHRIEDHLKGKSIITGRLHIYRKLVKQSRNHMALYTDWIKDMLTDMLSTVREIQTQATHLGMEAGFSLRQGNLMLRKMTEILQTSNEDETYIQFYMRNLSDMVKDKQRSAAVPPIWSVITLFLRCPLDRWDNYNPWFSLIQVAFNTSDSQTKHEANYAWNRYVFLCLMDNKPTSKLLSTLCQPLISQLRRRANTKQLEESKNLRRTVIGGICNLYYYAFRPGSERLSPPEVTWDIAVQPVISQLLGLDGHRDVPTEDVLQASRILVGLLDVSTPTVWKEDRIVDLPPVKPDDLPSIESKWIRKNSERVFKTIGPVLEKKFLDLANKESLTHRLWQAVVGSVAAASAKDIKVSEDTARFFACAFDLLSHIWSKGCADNEELLRSKFYPSVRNFITILLEGLGLLPFMEKKLSMTVPNTFEPVATPSHRPDRPEKPRGIVRTPLQHLFTMLSSVPHGGADDEAFSDFFQSVFKPFFVGKSDKIRVELTRELLRLSPQNTPSPFALWKLGAQAVKLSFSMNAHRSSQVDTNVPGPEFREIVSLLERGLTSHPNLSSTPWLSLFDAFCQRVTADYGDAGRAIVILKPLAKTLVAEFGSNPDQPSPKLLEAARAVFDSAKLPRDQQALDVARRRIWGDPAIVTKAGSPDPFDSLYKLGSLVSRYYYDHLDNSDPVPFINAMGKFVVESMAITGFDSLAKLQAGLSLWFQDEKNMLKINSDSQLSISIRGLWTTICTELARNGPLDKGQFDRVEVLLTAAFRSQHRFIVNKAAEAWNAAVKDQESIECSDSFKSVVSSLRPQVDITLPGVEQADEDFGAQPVNFLDSQEDAGPPAPAAPSPSPALTGSNISDFKGVKISVLRRTARPSPPPRRRVETTPESSRISKRVTRSGSRVTPRLRHDNSQIQFEPIASSSPVADESQNLTERQKEVRERQRQNAAMYSDVQTGSPVTGPATSAKKAEASAKATAGNAPKATPERATSYSELITSTPTPRRGQLLLIEGENDPASSPPEPRPYPLLSEIRSRSSTNHLESWNFSSPPSSPAVTRQQAALEAEQPQVTLTEGSSPTKPPNKGRSTRSMGRSSISFDVIPSSIPEKTTESGRVSITRSGKVLRSDQHDVAPETPPTKRVSRASKAAAAAEEQLARSVEEEFVDARGSVERSSPVLPEMPPQQAAAAADDDDDDDTSSLELSEVDDSQLMKFVVELESRRCDSPLNRHAPSSSPAKQQETEHVVVECITVHTDSSSPSPSLAQRRKRKSQSQSQDFIPSTPVEPPSEPAEEAQDEVGEQVGERLSSPQSRNKRKRKSGELRRSERRCKKRRSISASEAAVQQAEASKDNAETVASSSPVKSQGVKTRRSTRQSQKEQEEHERQQQRQEQKQQKQQQKQQRRRRNLDQGKGQGEDRDTDEEVFSQLMTESNAASQSQSQLPSDDANDVEVDMDMGEENDEISRPNLGGTNQGDGGVDKTPAVVKVEEEGESGPGSGDASHIIGRLQGELERLRAASLSRDEVYKIEDMLMDMKRELFEAERRGRQSV